MKKSNHSAVSAFFAGLVGVVVSMILATSAFAIASSPAPVRQGHEVTGVTLTDEVVSVDSSAIFIAPVARKPVPATKPVPVSQRSNEPVWSCSRDWHDSYVGGQYRNCTYN